MFEYISVRRACWIAKDLKKNPDNLGKHMATLLGFRIDAETLRESSLEHSLALYVKDEDYGEDVSELLLEYCDISNVAKLEHDRQMERLREIRDSLYPERPPRDVDLIFGKKKWTPMPYDKDRNTLQRLWDEIPQGVDAPRKAMRKKRKPNFPGWNSGALPFNS